MLLPHPGTFRWLGPVLSIVLGSLAVAGCGGGETTSGTGGSGGTTATTGGTGGVGGMECDAGGTPPSPPSDWCERIPAGPPGANSPAVDWSAAHALVRFFGPVEAYSLADQALAGALASDEALSGADISVYANALPGVVCAHASGGASLGAAKVSSMGDVAIVTPGTGPVALPEGTKAVFVDLRELPWASGLRDVIVAAVAPALAAPIPGLAIRVRRHFGMVDEVFAANNVYTNSLAKAASLPELPSGGAVDLPLAVLTDADMPAEAVEIAATLRLANRAWLFGEDLRVEVAESRWRGIGPSGLAIRVRDLYAAGGQRLPDEIPADSRSAKPECLAGEILSRGPIPALSLGAAERASIKKTAPFDDIQAPGDPLGDARASLIIADGAARTFFPYFSVVGDIIDPRLEETLSDLPAAPSREDQYHALHRFGNALSDGHNFVFDGMPATAGYLPVYIEDIDGAPVIRRSAEPLIVPGDTIASIDGVPAADWYAIELARAAGATPGYHFNLATRELNAMSGPLALGLVHADGAEETVTVDPHPAADYFSVLVASARPAGPLTDMGAPDLYYINLDNSVLDAITTFRDRLTEAGSAKGLVLDMRGYPGIDHYEVARRVLQTAGSSPIFRVPVLTGPEPPVYDESSYPMSPLQNPSFAGPIALLVGHTTVSAAENFSTILVDAGRVHVIGRNSAGTNGNITGVQVPGNFTFSFTGMDIRHADAQHSVFHGIGIVPDIEVPLTPQDFAAGVDPELEAAIAWLAMQ